ncbi:MAG: heme exporter protein CcmB [Alphaproteobacteria bacterium]|nr:heme exporter protein CcmB [Alphaproteobacteria bacterium]
MKAFVRLFARDVGLAFRHGGGAGLAIAFFVLAVTLFPLGIGPGPEILARVGAGVVWVAALLATLLSLDRLFQADYEDGSLDLLALTPLPLELTVLAKCAAHWATTGVPLLVAAPILALLLNLDVAGLGALLLAMLLGTPILSIVGAIGAALTVGVRRGGALLSILVLPLYVPVLIFGVAAIDGAISGLGAKPHLLVLGAFLLGALALGPWAAAASLRLNLD